MSGLRQKFYFGKKNFRRFEFSRPFDGAFGLCDKCGYIQISESFLAEVDFLPQTTHATTVTLVKICMMRATLDSKSKNEKFFVKLHNHLYLGRLFILFIFRKNVHRSTHFFFKNIFLVLPRLSN